MPYYKIKIGNNLKDNNHENIGYYLFPIFNALVFFSTFVFKIRAGFIAGIIILTYVLLHMECLKCFRDLPFAIFFLVNIASVVAYLYNGRPISIYLSCITYNLIPMLMYGIGRANPFGEKDNPVYKALIYSNIVVLLVGFLIYFFPGFAQGVGMESMAIDQVGMGFRFSSYMGSLELGSICSISIPLLLIVKFKHKLTTPIMLTLFSLAVLLTMQRGAWLVGIMGILGCMFISIFFEEKKFKNLIVYLLLGSIVCISLVYFMNHFMSIDFLEYFKRRISLFSVESMTSSRAYQMEDGLRTFLSNPLGFGLGAAGNKASIYGMQIVPDGNLIRIMVETGILGILSFAIMNIKAILNGFRSKCYYLTLIIGLFLAHSIGSNVLDFYYGSFIYWYILGYLNSPNRYGTMNNSSSQN